MHILAFMLSAFMQLPATELSYEQLLDAITTSRARITDVEFVCEGGVRYVDTEQPDAEKSRRLDQNYQCIFAYRTKDNACYTDLFRKLAAEPEDEGHFVTAVLNGKVNAVTIIAGLPESAHQVRSGVANPSSTFAVGSPDRFTFLFNYFGPLLKYRDGKRSKFIRWENVDGNRCAVIELSERDEPPTNYHRFWIDLDRGAWPLRLERYNKDTLWSSVGDIKLAAFPVAGGRSVWLPVHAVYRSYANGRVFKKTPVLEETYDVVKGSVLLNRNLSDARFDIRWKGARAETPSIREATRKIENAPPKVTGPPPRTDPEGVRLDQEARLAAAEAQSAMLDASPGASSLRLVDLLPWLSAVLGLAVLVGAAIVLRKHYRSKPTV